MDTFTVSIEVLFFLLFVGFFAGLVDSVAGGGGLIALPALLFIGIPPQMAFGTNKLQGSFGTLSATYNYMRNGQAFLKEALWGIFFTLLGSSFGATLIQSLNASFIKPLIPILLLIIFFYTLFTKYLGIKDRPPKMKRSHFFMIFGLLLGFYDGFFGPGTGSFWTVAFMLFLGFNITKATGFTKIMNFTSNIISLTCFIMGGNVSYSIGLTMAGGQIVGATLGSRLAVKKGTRFIRPFFLTVIFLTILRLAYVNYLM